MTTSNVAQTQPAALIGPGRPHGPIYAALALVLLIYAIQIPSPLRINTDASDLLQLAARLTDHQPYLLNGKRPVFPIGIPLVFSMMERLGIARPVGFAILNLLCLLIAAAATMAIYRALRLTTRRAAIASLLSFTSFTLVKHLCIPLTDIPYMAASLLCLAILESLNSAATAKKLDLVLPALMLLVVAVFFRRIGVALIPAMLYAIRPSVLRGGKWRQMIQSTNRSPFPFIALIFIVLVAVVWLGRYLFYLPDLGGPMQGLSLAQIASKLFHMRALDLGEILLNVSNAKLGRLQPLVPAAGIVLMLLIFLGFVAARRDLHPAHVYLLCYLAIMFVWPYGDNRFWLPVLPLLAMVVLQALQALGDIAAIRLLSAAYAAVYLLLFLAAAAYSTKITYSHDFIHAYGTGQTASDYTQAWSNGPVTTQAAYVIRRFSGDRR